ncbi:MAG: alpha/beta hydrolase [Anaerolineales bacterium]|nr:alpha/beta hydrolase [Anaerolineales bacterium]
MKIGEREIFLEHHGPENGLAVILLHHGLGTARSWRRQVPALASAGFHVVAYDRWGYGRSQTRHAIDIPGFNCDVEDLTLLMDALSIQRAALVGHSDGGTISLYFAAQCPERVMALVTVAAHVYVEPKMLPAIQGVREQFDSDQRFRTGLRRVHGNQYVTVFENWYNGWHSPACHGWNMLPLLAEITCPALVVQGLEDEHATPKHAEDLAAAIPKAELWLVADGRHMLPQEMPLAFNRRLLSFLRIFL